MTGQNNAAQPGLTDDEIIKHLEDAGVSFMWVQGKSPLHTTTGSQKAADIVTGIRAILSKLRAEGVQAGDERAAFERRFNIEHENWSAAGGGGYRNVWYEARWEGWKARAALASVPVTGNAVCKGSMALGSGCGKCERCRAELASAPVAGEAGAEIIRFNPFPGLGMNPAPNGLYVRYEDHAATLSSLAAPQASEAVRDAEDAARWRWATASDGNADKLCSIVLCHGGYQAKINERADVYRAALSAQPGAQRTGGSDA